MHLHLKFTTEERSSQKYIPHRPTNVQPRYAANPMQTLLIKCSYLQGATVLLMPTFSYLDSALNIDW